MMVGKGQPPKKPEDKRKFTSVMISPNERFEIDTAREKTNEKIGEFIRNAAVEKARKINEE